MIISDNVLLFTFIQDSEAAKAACDIYAVYGDDAIYERTNQWWFSWFKYEKFAITEAKHAIRPVLLDEERLNQHFFENLRIKQPENWDST